MLKTISGQSFSLFFAVSMFLVAVVDLSPLASADEHGALSQPAPSLVAIEAEPQDSTEDFSSIQLSAGNDKSELRALADWKAGLADFHKGDMQKASGHFIALLENQDLCSSDSAAVAFWAYRALVAKGDKQSAFTYLNKAAGQKPGFYSIIARHIVGREMIPHTMETGMIVDAAQKSAAAPYPMPHWVPASGGYKVEQALLFAIMRQESRFDPAARSSGGARGVMQLMPATAYAMARNIKLKGSISDPSISMALGQQYIQRLMEEGSIGSNLVYLLAAYNAGPGNLQEWQEAKAYDRDPLSFIESIPFGTTRDYVVNVMGNYWVYSELLGSETPSLVMISKGTWPLYEDASKPMDSAKADLN